MWRGYEKQIRDTVYFSENSHSIKLTKKQDMVTFVLSPICTYYGNRQWAFSFRLLFVEVFPFFDVAVVVGIVAFVAFTPGCIGR